MKKALLKLLETVVDVLFLNPEILVIPAVLVIIGLVCGFGWKYYVCGIAIYAAAAAVLLFAADRIGGWFGRRIADRISKKRKSSSDPDTN